MNVTVANPVDTTPPTVAGVTPVTGAVDVAVDAVVTAQLQRSDGPGDSDSEHV